MAETLVNTNASDREQKAFNIYRNYILPLMAVGEAIATKGKSPGTTALNAEQIFQNQEDRRRKMLQEEEDRANAAIDRALKQKQAGMQEQIAKEQLESLPQERALKQEQLSAAIQEREATKAALERANKFRSGLEEIENRKIGIDEDFVGPPTFQQQVEQNLSSKEKEKLKNTEIVDFIKQYVKSEKPLEFLNYEYKESQPDYITRLFAAQSASSATPPKLTTNDVDAMSSLKNSVYNLNKLEAKFNRKWAKPFVGQAMQDILTKFDTDRAEYETIRTNFANELLKARSGAAVKPQEYERFLKEIGDLSTAPDVWLARIKSIRSLIEDRYNTQLKTYKDANINVQNLEEIKKAEQDSSSYEIGSTIVKNNKKYKYIGNEQWEELE